MKSLEPREGDYKTASAWWDDLPEIYTPVGWKNHLFRFNVLWNGTIIAKPDLNRRTQDWKGRGAQFTFLPNLSDISNFSLFTATYAMRDDNMCRQGWADCAAPVLWTQWAFDGLVLRQEIFGHVSGGRDIVEGAEPLFAWVRYSIADALKPLPLENTHVFLVKINAPHFFTAMSMRGHELRHSASQYPRELSSDPDKYTRARGLRIMEKDGAVRIGILPGQDADAVFDKRTSKFTGLVEQCLRVEMPAKRGAHVDFLVPMLPAARGLFESEVSIGFDRALAEANLYWSRVPATAAVVETPEPEINEAIRHSLKFAEVIAERNPADGNYSITNGSYTYADLWPTPGSLVFAMLLDPYGYHEAAERYLEIFRKEQGTITPPGGAFERHPGYLSSPKTLTSIDWLADHGAILYAVCTHVLLSGNRDFVTRWTDTIVRACEFIKYARRIKNHGGVHGLMPPAVATDKMTRIQAIWNDGWNYKGLALAVRVLKMLGHPRAAEFAAEAAAYRKAFDKAFRAKAARLPKWTDSRGKKHPLLPTSLSGEKKEETRHAFYLDAGPLFLVFAGLMDAGDPLMESARLWFREGPPKRAYRRDGNCWQVPSLDHEMSSCEPCYSWNIFHSHALADRQKYLEGMYSLFAGALSRKTYISCETRGGVTGNLFACAPAAFLARLAVIDDTIKEGELHLLRLVPLAWLRPGRQATFENMATEFGPVTLRFGLSRDGRALRVVFNPDFRRRPDRIVLHVPPAGVRKVTVNRKTATVKASKVILTTRNLEPRVSAPR